MRLVGSIDNPSLCEQFSAYLKSQKIDHRVDIVVNNDWGSNDYGTAVCQIWVINEDDTDLVINDLEEFKVNPEQEKFKTSLKPAPLFPPHVNSLKPDQILETPKTHPPLKKPPSGKITLFIIFFCALIYLWGRMTAPSIVPYPASLPGIALFSPPINQKMMYDWPKAYSILDKVVRLYGIESLSQPNKMPREEQYLIQEYLKTPYWKGFYQELLVLSGVPKEKSTLGAPMFEQIRHGEIWRLITPVFLHADIFHILFNMLWLLILGRQLEDRLGISRYILFMLIVGVISDTFQYLMSGSNFIGYSGILTGMLGYIWIRQKTAPWEGYILQPGTLLMLTVFVLAMFGLQVTSFISQILFKTTFSPNIANTAHLTGAVVGIILGKINFFAWRKPQKS